MGLGTYPNFGTYFFWTCSLSAVNSFDKFHTDSVFDCFKHQFFFHYIRPTIDLFLPVQSSQRQPLKIMLYSIAKQYFCTLIHSGRRGWKGFIIQGLKMSIRACWSGCLILAVEILRKRPFIVINFVCM